MEKEEEKERVHCPPSRTRPSTRTMEERREMAVPDQKTIATVRGRTFR